MNTRNLLTLFFFFTALVAKSQIGTKDFSFGYMGVAYTTFDTMDVSGRAMVLQPDGKIVVGGSDSFQHAVLVRYNTDGSLDSTFGDSGKVITPVPLTGTASSPSLSLMSDSSTLLWAGSFNGLLTIIKYASTGTPDSSFATNGILQMPIIGGWRLAPQRMLVRGDTILIEASATDSITLNRVRLIRLLSNGNPDFSFGTNGTVDIAQDSSHVFPRSMLLLPDGKIVVACQASHLDTPMVDYDFGVVRLLANGATDTNWGTNGWVLTDFGFDNDDPSCMVLQTDSILIVCGTTTADPVNQLCLARYNYDGKPDSTFDGDGKLLTLYKNERDRAAKVLFKSDGSLIVGGSTDTAYFACIQLGPDGSRNENYNRFGVALGIMPGTSGQVYDITLQPDDKMLLAGDAILHGHRFMTVCRFEANPYPVGVGGGGEDFSIYPHNVAQIAVFVDNNHNGVRDTTEPYLYGGSSKVHEKRSGYSGYNGWINGDSVLVFDTTWFIRYVPPTRNYLVSPDSIASSVHGYNNRVYDTFGIVPIPGIADAAIKITLLQWIARVGTTINTIVTYGNVGTDTLSGIVKYAKPHLATYVGAVPVPASVVGDTITWNFTDQPPGQSNDIVISLGVPNPPVVQLHDWFLHYAIVIPNKTDSAMDDNEAWTEQIIGNAYDPNVKSEVHNGSISKTEIAAGGYLSYRIDFQNTGNDTAFNVFVKDVLDAGKVDPSSLEMLGTSHNVSMTLQGNIAVWTFNNINLPDSGHSQENSHGYINFRIRPRASVNIGDVINNAASIYFDQNAPIITNTEQTTVTGNILPMQLLSFTAKLIGEQTVVSGRQVNLDWTTINETKVDRYEIERSINSREFSKIGTIKAGQTQYSFIDEKPAMGKTNYYRLKMLDKDGAFTYSPIRMINNNGSFYVNIYPNPVKDALQVLIDFEKPGRLQLQVLSLDGKVLLGNSFSAGEGVSLRSIIVSALQKGSYLLKVLSGDNVEQVLKFEKL